MRKLVLATRGSKLALVQANMVKAMLEDLGAEIELHIIKTKGDKDQSSPLWEIGGKGLFVKEIELALLTGEADFAVHSGKDLPYLLAEGMTIGANPKCADPRDCLITRKGSVLPEDGIIGTGSPRRVAECKRIYPNAQYREIRGNVDTRLRKLKEGEYDAIFLARAGMDRLGLDLSDFEVRVFEPEEIIPAACQGILGVECRADDREVVELLAKISDRDSELRFATERKVFCALEADCSVAVAVHVIPKGEEISIYAMYEGKRFSGTCRTEQLDELTDEIKGKLMQHE